MKNKKKEQENTGEVRQQISLWHSKISWKIALAAFLTILTVQAIVLNFLIKKFEYEAYSDLKQVGRSALIATLDPLKGGFLISPFYEKDANSIVEKTPIHGFSVYSMQFDLLETYGEMPSIILNSRYNLDIENKFSNEKTYEIVYRASELNAPYFIAAKLNAENIQPQIFRYFIENLIIIALLSGLVTTVLMIALGKWLLEPILFLRKSLIKAAKDPENTDITENPYGSKDEIGTTIELAQKLIRQNADNFKTIRANAESQIHKLAYYDTLTGLPNRTMFLEALKKNSDIKDKQKVKRFGVLAMDLDHFKDFNDTMGHNVGDAILKSVGERLKMAAPEGAMVSRSGEDEFAITIPLEDKKQAAHKIAEDIVKTIKKTPFRVYDEDFRLSVSMGVAVFPDDGTDPDQVLKNADIALNRAKEEGRDRIVDYSSEFDQIVKMRFEMLRDLREAMSSGQITVHYQPQFDLRTGKIIGAEALVRWWRPDNSKQGGKFIPPFEFIPIAEQSGLIVAIGNYVLETACQDLMHWRDTYNVDMRIAVNVSAMQFSQSNLVNVVKKTIEKTNMNPHNLELEVTESVFMDDIKHTIAVLANLNKLGVELAIDDFGTGYSSLSYLRQFPIDRLKIDQSFTRNALTNADDAAITRTIIALGQILNLKVIAEGVETKEHENFLVEHNCDEVQGYRYARPMPAEQFEDFLKNYKGDLSAFD